MKSVHQKQSRFRRSPKSRSGYTLVEIILVLSIITILLGAGIRLMIGNVEDARRTRVDSDISSITTQLKAYEMNNLFLPTTEQGLQALVTKPTTEPIPRRWHPLFSQVPIDPWGMPYQYRYPGKHNPDSFDLYSFGPDRKESDDDIGNWENTSQ